MNLTNARILVTGASGMLGSEFVELLASKNLLLTDYKSAQGIEELDICDVAKVNKLIAEFKPNLVINCAAYTNVDLAEKEVEKCFLINSIGPQNLANALKDSSSILVHISTDYVFGSSASEAKKAYTEIDSASPCGVYGMSKYIGDQFVTLIKPKSSLIIRTSWLHGRNGQSFVDKILAVAKTKSEIKVVNDQIGSPTWAPWLAAVTLKLIEGDRVGIYNASSAGGISWFDFAKEIVLQAGLSCVVLPQNSIELARSALRPSYSVLDLSKLQDAIGPVVNWKYGIEQHLKNNGSR